MMIIDRADANKIQGCDYHPGFQQIAYVNTDTGELSEARLGHKEQAEQFCHELSQRAVTVRVGMEASGHARWFERLLNELRRSNHDRGCDRRDGWVGLSSCPATISSEPKVGLANFNQSEMALDSERMPQCARKRLDTADIVRDGDVSAPG